MKENRDINTCDPKFYIYIYIYIYIPQTILSVPIKTEYSSGECEGRV